MDPTQTPQQGQPTSPTSAPSTSAQPQYNFSPTTVALTKAIGKAESGGNYNAPDNTGDGAHSSGAYQFTPGFLQEWAPKAGVQYQSGISLTPQQQDEIASTAVQTMLTQGDPAYPSDGKLSPAQVVSAWNTGDPNAYLDSSYGENNTYGSTQNEVNKVGEYYKQLTNSTSPTAPADSSGGTNTALALGAGALGAGALATVASDGTDLLAPVTDAIGGLAGDVGSWISGALGITDLKNAVSGLTDSAGGTGSGGGTGGTGGTTPPAATPQGAPQDEPTPQTEEAQINQSENESAAQSKSALDSVANGLKNMVSGMQGGRVLAQNPQGQDAISTAAAFNLIGQDENGNAVFNEDARKQALGEVSKLDDAVSASSGGSVHPLSVSNLAGSEIAKNRLMTSSARKDTAKIIQDEMRSDTNGDVNAPISAPRLRELAKQHNAAGEQAYKEGNYTPTPKSMAHKALGRAYANALDKALEGDPHAQELHRRAMKMEQALIRAKDLKKHINGKKIPKNNGLWESFLRQGARAAEIYIGDKLGGPIGAIVGGLLGEGLNRKITQKFGRNIFDTPGMKAAFNTLRDTKPKEYNDLVTALRKKGIPIPDDEQKPSTEEGLVKQVKKDESKFQKGLVSLKR